MSDHISDKQMEAFCARDLIDSELAATAEHVAACTQCQCLFQETLKRKRGNKLVSISLSPVDWFRHEHLDYDQLESFAENRLDAEETTIVNLHLETCTVCRKDVHSFLEFREATENEPHTRRTPEPRIPKTKKPSERKPSANRWKLAYTVATLLMIGSAALVGMFFSRQAVTGRQSPIPESPQAISSVSTPLTPESSPAVSVTPPVTPESSPSVSVTSKPAESGEDKVDSLPVVSLVDGAKNIRFNESGVVSGLETFPERIRQNITEALLTGIPKRSAGLSELMSGLDKGSPGAILYPKRIVIVEDRPTFRWAPTAGATNYQIRVSDPNGNLIAHSGQLPTDTTQWKPSERLQRGIVYSWSVIAVVSGKWVAAETNFKALEGDKLGELAMLKNQHQSHLALGLFYTREGVLIEARRELELLVRDNPNSPIAAKLLSQARSRR